MQLLKLGAVGHERPAVRGDDGIIYDLSGITSEIDGGFFESGGVERVRRALHSGLPALSDADALRVGAPIAKPGTVVCIGQNYAAHAAESGGPPPQVPIPFFKHPSTVVGPCDDIPYPRGTTALDWEVELGVVIGKRARCIESVQDAVDRVAGFVTSHDVSERIWQQDISGGQWSKGKTAESSIPVGPALVPGDVAGLGIESSGSQRQSVTAAS